MASHIQSHLWPCMGLRQILGEQIPSAALPFLAASSVMGGQKPEDLDFLFFFLSEA